MMKPLGEVASVSTAYPFRGKVDSEAGGDVAVIQMRDVDPDFVDGPPNLRTIWVRNEGGRFDRHLIREGDLLFQSRGSRHPAMVAADEVRAIAGSGVHVIRVDPAVIVPQYLCWWINHPSTQRKLVADIARGSNVPFVSKGDLERFELPVPPIAVQRQIVEVDRLRTRERVLRTRLESLQQQLVDRVTLSVAVHNKSREQ
jgi:hypothetical protein